MEELNHIWGILCALTSKRSQKGLSHRHTKKDLLFIALTVLKHGGSCNYHALAFR